MNGSKGGAMLHLRGLFARVSSYNPISACFLASDRFGSVHNSWKRLIPLAVSACFALQSSGCSFIAKDGPVAPELRSNAATVNPAPPDLVGYALVDVSPSVLQAANHVTNGSDVRFGRMARGAGPDVSIGAGDILNVTIFEAESGGLFIPKEAGSRAGNYIQLPNQQVDASGNITVPYITTPVRVLGRTARAVSLEVSSELSKRAIEPQAVVSVVEHRGNDVSVLGEVNMPQRFSIDPGGIQLLSAIARAGGPKNPSYETMVSIQRGGQVHRARMSSIVKDPSENVPMRPHDVVYLARDPRYYVVLGATPSPGSVGGINDRRFTFENDTMTLSEAIGKAGGLDSLRADAKEVFLFRFEPREMLEAAGTDVSRFGSARVPTIYTVDLSKSASFFLTDGFQIRDKDLIFVSDAPEVDLLKFLQVVTVLSGSAYNGSQVALAAK